MAASPADIARFRNRETTNMISMYLSKLNRGGMKCTTTTISGVRVRMYREGGDTLGSLHKKSVERAITTVVNAGHHVPDLIVYMTATDVPNVAMKTYAAGADTPEPVVFLGPRMWAKNPMAVGTNAMVVGGSNALGVRGVADQMYDGTQRWFGNPKRHAQGESIVIHEIGHVLHEIHNPGMFWEVQDLTERMQPIVAAPGWMMASVEVSGYAGKNALEFVAEVFTGVIAGKTYSPAVMTAYNQLGGP